MKYVMALVLMALSTTALAFDETRATTTFNYTLKNFAKKSAASLAKELNRIHATSLSIKQDTFCQVETSSIGVTGSDLYVSASLGCGPDRSGELPGDQELEKIVEVDLSAATGIKMEIPRMRPWPAASGSN
ncbi:MAG: hypothetical protein V4692_02630 [Bdellovibrionota bacterium]